MRGSWVSVGHLNLEKVINTFSRRWTKAIHALQPTGRQRLESKERK